MRGKHMDRQSALCAYLRKHHRGKANAVHSRELERLFSLTGRTLRRRISRLRQDGYPVCSDENGYYYAENQNEINATVCRLNMLVTKISNARTGMLYASVMTDETVKVRDRKSVV